MASKSKKSIQRLVYIANIAIDNSLNEPKIYEKISSYGYTTDKLTEGRNLLDRVNSIIDRHSNLFGEQKELTKAVEKAQRDAFKAYQNLIKVARAVLSKEQLAQLGVTGPMPKSIANFLSKANTAFNNAITISTIKSELNAYGYDDKKIQIEHNKIKVLEELNERQESAKGEFQQLTREKEAVIKELDKWLSKFIKIARVAFSDNKEALEKLGIRVYSKKTPAQRQAPKKASETKKKKKSSS